MRPAWPQEGDPGRPSNGQENGVSPPFSLDTGPPTSPPRPHPGSHHPAARPGQASALEETGTSPLRPFTVTWVALNTQRRV